MISTVVATMAAYALARGRSRMFRWLEALFLSGLMLPIHLAILPIFYLFDGLGLIDSRFGLMLMYARLGHPVLDLRPHDVLPAAAGGARGGGARSTARAAGRPSGGSWCRSCGPRSRPWPSSGSCRSGTTSSSRSCCCAARTKYTLPVGLTTFFGENATNYSAVFAGLVITTVPLIVLFLVATKQIVAGLTAGMAK